MIGCVNNKIQEYMELLVKETNIRERIDDDEYMNILYEYYKDIRVEIASKGYILLTKPNGEEKMISNPKAIAGGLFYLFCVKCGQSILQRDIMKIVGITHTPIANSYRAIQQLS